MPLSRSWRSQGLLWSSRRCEPQGLWQSRADDCCLHTHRWSLSTSLSILPQVCLCHVPDPVSLCGCGEGASGVSVCGKGQGTLEPSMQLLEPRLGLCVRLRLSICVLSSSLRESLRRPGGAWPHFQSLLGCLPGSVPHPVFSQGTRSSSLRLGQELPLSWEVRVQKCQGLALVRQFSWLGHCPVHQRVAGSIPGQSTHLGCGFHP